MQSRKECPRCTAMQPSTLRRKCPYCTEVFGDGDKLLQHLKLHLKLIVFDCDFCGKEFRCSSSFKKHMQCHYKCVNTGGILKDRDMNPDSYVKIKTELCEERFQQQNTDSMIISESKSSYIQKIVKQEDDMSVVEEEPKNQRKTDVVGSHCGDLSDSTIKGDLWDLKLKKPNRRKTSVKRKYLQYLTKKKHMNNNHELISTEKTQTKGSKCICFLKDKTTIDKNYQTGNGNTFYQILKSQKSKSSNKFNLNKECVPNNSTIAFPNQKSGNNEPIHTKVHKILHLEPESSNFSVKETNKCNEEKNCKHTFSYPGNKSNCFDNILTNKHTSGKCSCNEKTLKMVTLHEDRTTNDTLLHSNLQVEKLITKNCANSVDERSFFKINTDNSPPQFNKANNVTHGHVKEVVTTENNSKYDCTIFFTKKQTKKAKSNTKSFEDSNNVDTNDKPSTYSDNLLNSPLQFCVNPTIETEEPCSKRIKLPLSFEKEVSTCGDSINVLLPKGNAKETREKSFGSKTNVQTKGDKNKVINKKDKLLKPKPDISSKILNIDAKNRTLSCYVALEPLSCIKNSSIKIMPEQIRKQNHSIYSEENCSSKESADAWESFSCIHCKNRFNCKNLYNQHMLKHFLKKNFDCMICPESFWKRNSLLRHLRVKHELKSNVCMVCGIKIHHWQEYCSHVRTHPEQKHFHAYKCLHCQKGFDLQKEFASHKNSNHKSRRGKSNDDHAVLMKKRSLVKVIRIDDRKLRKIMKSSLWQPFVNIQSALN